jgi:hypothetical protein
MTVEFLALQMHLLSTLRVLRSKQHNMLAWGVTNLAHLITTTLFPYAIVDNALKRHTLEEKHVFFTSLYD